MAETADAKSLVDMPIIIGEQLRYSYDVHLEGIVQVRILPKRANFKIGVKMYINEFMILCNIRFDTDYLSASREKINVYKRTFITEILRENGFTLKEIARTIKRSDHTTILNLLNYVSREIEYIAFKKKWLIQLFDSKIPIVSKKVGDKMYLEEYLKQAKLRYPDKTEAQIRAEYAESLRPEKIRSDLGALIAEINKIKNFIGY